MSQLARRPDCQSGLHLGPESETLAKLRCRATQAGPPDCFTRLADMIAHPNPERHALLRVLHPACPPICHVPHPWRTAGRNAMRCAHTRSVACGPASQPSPPCPPCATIITLRALSLAGFFRCDEFNDPGGVEAISTTAPPLNTDFAAGVPSGGDGDDTLSRCGCVPDATGTSAESHAHPSDACPASAPGGPVLPALSSAALFSPNRRRCSTKNHRANIDSTV